MGFKDNTTYKLQFFYTGYNEKDSLITKKFLDFIRQQQSQPFVMNVQTVIDFLFDLPGFDEGFVIIGEKIGTE